MKRQSATYIDFNSKYVYNIADFFPRSIYFETNYSLPTRKTLYIKLFTQLFRRDEYVYVRRKNNKNKKTGTLSSSPHKIRPANESFQKTSYKMIFMNPIRKDTKHRNNANENHRMLAHCCLMGLFY